MSHPGLGGRDKSTRRSLSVSGSTVIGAVIGALATIAAAFIGGAYAGPRIGLVIAQPTVTITPPTVTITPAASPATTSQAGSGGSTGTSPGTVLLQKQGVQLTQGYQLSFIDPALRPMPTSACPGGDLSVCGQGVTSTGQLAVYPGRAGFSQCQADTTYVSLYADPNGQSLTGTTLCVTTGNRLAVCYVTADTTQANTAAPGLIMDITVYADT
jgi:hypothetical protein